MGADFDGVEFVGEAVRAEDLTARRGAFFRARILKNLFPLRGGRFRNWTLW
jgi:hypothetical protein